MQEQKELAALERYEGLMMGKVKQKLIDEEHADFFDEFDFDMEIKNENKKRSQSSRVLSERCEKIEKQLQQGQQQAVGDTNSESSSEGNSSS